MWLISVNQYIDYIATCKLYLLIPNFQKSDLTSTDGNTNPKPGSNFEEMLQLSSEVRSKLLRLAVTVIYHYMLNVLGFGC